MILDPGSFRVSDYRKSMSWRVKCEALLLSTGTGCGLPLTAIEFDHRPPLCDRPYDTDAGDFVPGQNDPRYIIPRTKAEHLEKTTGRKAGADRTVTTSGSDIGNRRKTSDIRARELYHKAVLASKAGRIDESVALMAEIRLLKKKHTRPKQKIPQRINPWRKRKFPLLNRIK